MTQSPELPADISAFVDRHFDTVAQLEGLLLMRESAPATWSATQLAARLYVAPEDAQIVLTTLHRRQLLESTGEGFRYAPASELHDQVDRLAAAYARHLIAITRLIHAKPSASLRNFAEAFRLRNKE